MVESITLCSADDVRNDSRVCHYDELSEPVKEQFPTLLESNVDAAASSLEGGLDGCDYVKYVEYYEIVRE